MLPCIPYIHRISVVLCIRRTNQCHDPWRPIICRNLYLTLNTSTTSNATFKDPTSFFFYHKSFHSTLFSEFFGWYAPGNIFLEICDDFLYAHVFHQSLYSHRSRPINFLKFYFLKTLEACIALLKISDILWICNFLEDLLT